ncbi:MAG: LTA synthase family protein [Lachnospiraceae bacterium]|nr:LTA synthase family protein [Lachnospiraceae bacterium]
MKERIIKVGKMHVICCMILSVLINMAVEALSRKSVIKLFEYIFESPYVFFYNCIIILLTLLPVLFFRRRMFFYTCISFIWIGFGITNSILLIFRTTPFTAVDFLLIKSAIRVLNNYFSVVGIVFLVLLIFAAILLCAFLFKKAPKFTERIPRVRYLGIFLGTILIFVLATNFGIYTNRIAVNFGNIGEAFMKYGFPYCFSNSIFNTGIDRPDEYSDEMVVEILYNINENNQGAVVQKKDTPNIIFLQLESFFDTKYVKDITVSKNPIPNFQSLKSEFSSGFVRVPSVGAGTANTEFEMITGMNLDFFGPGEYPYKTILQDTTCESYPFVLKTLGYSTHAIHNNEGTFYERNEVFSNLGFDTFTSIEYMYIDERTSGGWAKDYYLTGHIMDCLKSTDTPDYVYTISVQGHGKYPEEINPDEYDILAYNTDEEINPEFTYFVQQTYEMDAFIGELLNTLKNFNEKTVVVMYGDHLPSLEITNDRLINGDIYQTEYIIWSNFDINNVNKNLEAYQLGAHVMDMLDIDTGIISLYHRFFMGEDDYLDNLQVLQYDMLYGDNEVYDGTTPYLPTKLQMGIWPITIKSVEFSEEEELLYIKGDNFTKYSVVMLDGKDADTQYVDAQNLICKCTKLNFDTVCIAQIGEDKAILSLSEEYNYVEEE